MTTSKKNVLAFLNAFWNYGAGMSGGDQMFIQIFKRIRGELGELSCVTNPDGKRAIAAQVENVDFYQSPAWFDRLGVMVSYVLRTVYALRCLRLYPDVIYSGSDFFPDVLPAFLLKLFRPKVRWIQCVFHIYPDWRKRPGSALRSVVAEYLQRFSFLLVRRADVILNINEDVKRDLIGKGFAQGQIAINPPGIDLGRLRAIPEALNTTGYDGVFLGRLNPSKGVFDLLLIWKQVVKTRPESQLAIIGGGSAEIVGELQRRILDSGLSGRVEILGYLRDEEAFGILKKSKVFLFPSREEGFGIVLLEAIACGCRAIAWNLSVYDLLFADAIKRVPLGDVAAFSNAVIDALTPNNGSSTKRSASVLEIFSWDSSARRTLALIEASV